MPIDPSTIQPETGVKDTAGPSQVRAKKARLPTLKKRRLGVGDVNIVNGPMLKKALSGTVVGNTMEWYDVGVFGYLIGTMGPVFLPTADKDVQTLFLLGTFAATFLARPLGGVVFGWLGDKVGRQKVLAATLIVMAASTFAVGLLPGYSQIGIWAAVLLVVVKLIQGFSTGGEYAGATTFVSEYAPDKRRGFFASILDLGSYMGFAIGAALVSVMQLTLGQEAMEQWGWRIPFLIAGPLGLIAVYFRMKIEESPQFQATLDANEANSKSAAAADEDASGGPVRLVKVYWRQIVLAMVLVAAANTAGYALTSYMPTYLSDSMGYDPVHGTILTIPILVAMAVCIPLTGRLSDKVGRRPILWVGALSTVVLAVPAFMLIAVGPVWTTLLGLALIAFPVTFYVSNLASALPALFPTSSRYGGMGISYNFAVAIFGGTAPFIMKGLIKLTGNDMMPAYYLILTSAIGAVAIYFLRESAQKPLPGSMPSVATLEEAHELVATQDENPLLDMDYLPFDDSYEPPTPGTGIPVTVGRPEAVDA
ncbi:MFS transporter [Arthrobacter psychrochitiniphilus]|uniref:Putative proline/betaine transporter n=1 Tax=Arthrobacter psychrochitiniphilus TaxID=291045 RepID=A0A2V3DS17_9MICC|nr:MFS transporter [Arthrobacter psychrochitiniphilus]NYG19050.1 MHS family proline/betaine transporter-like MFS transporter [Arthrobacter psychrochitiniphilus]PXA65975.1 MFS transporter [Arthrobacter psychrochitiniphilus]